MELERESLKWISLERAVSAVCSFPIKEMGSEDLLLAAESLGGGEAQSDHLETG